MYRGAIIGLGNIGLTSHLPAYLKTEQAEIAAGCDLEEKNMERFQKLLPSARIYSDVKEMFEKERLDFIDICTPPDTHFDIISLLDEKRINIICEKPVSVDLETIFKIKKIVSLNKLVFMPVHQYRYSPLWQKILGFIREGKIGNVILAQFFVYRTEANKGNEFWRPRWRSDLKVSGGGIVVDHGAHLFYLVSSILGKPRFITARTGKLRHLEYTVEDTAWINIEYENAAANFALTWAAKKRETNILILGTNGEISARENEITLNTSDSEETIKIEEGLSGDSRHSGWYVPLLNEFFRRLDKKDFSEDALNEAALTALCISGVYKSAEMNKTVALEFDEE